MVVSETRCVMIMAKYLIMNNVVVTGVAAVARVERLLSLRFALLMTCGVSWVLGVAAAVVA
jgi:hypothetical protein